MSLFVPDYIFEDITYISPEFLKEQGVSCLVLDVDNTLTGHGSQELSPEISAWLVSMKEAGIKMMIASNNVKDRVEPFAARIGLDFVSFSCKPGPAWLIAAKKKFAVKKKDIALVGDQIFTDLLGAKLYGAKVFMVKPMYEDYKPTIRLKRKLEKPFLARYYKKGGKLIK